MSDSGVAPEARGDAKSTDLEAFVSQAEDLASERENYGFDNYVALIADALSVAYTNGKVDAEAAPSVATPPCKRCGELERDLNAHIIEVAVLTRERDEARAVATPPAPPMIPPVSIRQDRDTWIFRDDEGTDFRIVYTAYRDCPLQIQKERMMSYTERSEWLAAVPPVPPPAVVREYLCGCGRMHPLSQSHAEAMKAAAVPGPATPQDETPDR